VPDFPWEQPLGAHPAGDGRTTFRTWAPRAERVAVRLHGEEHPLRNDGPPAHGVYAATLPAGHGDDYELVLDGTGWPDPHSRWQPQGIRGPSRVLDPGRLAWTDEGWEGVALRDAVIYEMHVGTFTAEGTFDAAIGELPRLAALGITVVEVMPVAEFPGARGWGYDGIFLSATQSSYGGPEAFARFVDAAHGAGLAVVLDVVHNHVGASGGGMYEAFGPFFTQKVETFWGKAVNLDDEYADPAREWILQSAEGWIADLHLDGLRLDAIHALHDMSAEHLVAALTRRVHALNPRALVIAESGMNDPKVVRGREQGGWGCDAAWADDFHHALRVACTGEAEGYYEEFTGLETLAKAFRRPHVHDGTYSTFRKRRFGAPAGDVPPERFVVFAQDHDQVGNRALGDRPPAAARPLMAFATLLSPFTPMLFMGEEHGETAPFQFFTDHVDPDIAEATREGRRREFAAFAAFAGEEVPDPQDPATFEASKLTGRGEPAGIADLYATLLRVRRDLPGGDADDVRLDGRVLTVRRGGYTMVMNFGEEEAQAAGTAGEVVVATHAGATPGALPPLAGVLVR
jgi:maltooligosyltrehalose trehalohydrolase